MLYYFNSSSAPPVLPSSHFLKITEVDDIAPLTALTTIAPDEIRRRLANDNRAYIAFYKNRPAAFGWSGAGKAFIGELNHELVLPIGHKYLWNFRTIENFRGLGIYPQLLQHIIRSERSTTKCFWILHSPENISSRNGIVKAGFRFVSAVTVKNLDNIFVNAHRFEYSEDLKDMGFNQSQDQHASCWTCSSPYVNHKRTQCCCSSVQKECNQSQFIPA